MQTNRELFETMPVRKALATLAIPTVISQLITMIYNLADTFFIGRTNDPYKVAAASVSFVLFFVMNALANLFGVGGGSLISRLLGRKQEHEAGMVCAFSIYGTIAVTLVYSLGCLVFMDPLLRLIGASDNTIAYARAYAMWVVVIGGIPSTLSMAMAHLLRSEGHASQASFGLGMGGVINMVLDPLFMFVLLAPGQEVTGAAVATMLSNCIALAYFWIVFVRLRRTTILRISPRLVPQGFAYAGRIFAVGLPSALGSLLACVANTCINALAAGYGDIPVAAFGIVKKIDMLPMNIGMGLCQGMMPLVAYNYASGNYARMKQTASCARLWGMLCAAACVVTFEVFAQGIVRIFIDEVQTVQMGVRFLRICCLATPLMICNFQMSYTFQAMGMGKQSLFLTSCRQGLINIPLLFAMNALFGVYGVVWTQFLADLLTVVLSAVLYRRVVHTLATAMDKKVPAQAAQ